MNPLIFTVHRNVQDEFYFRIRDHEDTILLTSAFYQHLPNCLHDIHTVQQYHNFILECDLKNDESCQRFFLKSSCGRILAISSVYLSFKHLLNDMQLIKSYICIAEIEDRSTGVRFFRRADVKK
jgi:uncharacterized protein YegP (UPF0339 family)